MDAFNRAKMKRENKARRLGVSDPSACRFCGCRLDEHASFKDRRCSACRLVIREKQTETRQKNLEKKLIEREAAKAKIKIAEQQARKDERLLRLKRERDAEKAIRSSPSRESY